MKASTFPLIIWSLLALALPARAQETLPESMANIPVDSLIIESPEGAPVNQIKSGYLETTGDQAELILQNAIAAQQNDGHVQLLITTDSPELFAGVEDQIATTGPGALGVLTEPDVKAMTPEAKASFLRRSFTYTKDSLIKRPVNFVTDSFRKGPIGVMITTYLVGADILQWVHASSYTKMTVAGAILTDVVVNVRYGLNKTAWPEAATKLGKKLVTPILKRVGFANLDTPRAEFMVKMISSFTMTLTLQAIRLGFIVGGGSADVLMGEPHFHYTDVAIKAGVTAFLVATAMTFNGFGWDNWTAELIKNEEKHLPTDKFAKPTMRERAASATIFLTNRFYEGRSLVTGSHITSAALMSPSMYGYSSWAWVAVHGSVGLATYLSKKLTSRVLQAAGEKTAQISARFSEEVISFREEFFDEIWVDRDHWTLRCESLFAN